LNGAALRTLAGVPSGTISMSNFYGKSNFSVVTPFMAVTAVTIYRETTLGSAASISVLNDGSIGQAGNTDSGVPVQAGWGTPISGTPGNNYWVRATMVSGSLSSGTINTWINITSTVTWGRSDPSGGGSTGCVLYLQLATDAAGSSIVATSPNITLIAYKTT